MFGKRRQQAIECLLQSGYRYATALAAGHSEAEDLVHDAWVRLCPRYGSLPDKPLLFRTIRHLHIDEARQRQRTRWVEFDENEASAHAGAELSTQIAELPDVHLTQALAALGEAERETLFLSVVEGYTASEIATLTDRPRGTVLSMVHRARLKLRQSLEEQAAMDPVNDHSRVSELPTSDGRKGS